VEGLFATRVRHQNMRVASLFRWIMQEVQRGIHCGVHRRKLISQREAATGFFFTQTEIVMLSRNVIVYEKREWKFGITLCARQKVIERGNQHRVIVCRCPS
jgi:hypothetical protein